MASGGINEHTTESVMTSSRKLENQLDTEVTLIN